MHGTRRTIVAATASLAVVLGLGGVAAATSPHGSHSDDPAAEAGSTTSVSVHVAGEHHQRGKGPGSRHLLEATSTTVDPATSTTIADATTTTVEEPTTSRTVEDETSTTVGDTTSTTVEPGDDHGHDGKVRDHDPKDHEAHDKDEAGEHDGQGATDTGQHDGHGGGDSGSHQGRD